MGGGNAFENKVVDLLNQKKYSEIEDPFWRRFLKEIFPEVREEDEFKVEKLGGIYKADVLIYRGESQEPVGVSLKSGGGNSVHQEPLGEFICFCRNELDASNDICHYLEWFIMERKNANALYLEHPERFDALNEFFLNNRIPLLRRFLITGTANKGFADVIVHTNGVNLVFAKTEDIIRECENNSSSLIRKRRNKLYVGPLTFQAWNRNVSGDPTRPSEKKRGHIQLKWGNIHSDLEMLGG